MRSTVVTEHGAADAFVIDSPTEMSRQVKFSAQLIGGIVCNELCVQAAGHSGVVVAYKSQIKTRRVIWISSDFIDKHLDASTALVAIVSRNDCKWKLYGPDELHAFRDNADRCLAARKTRTAVAFIVAAEVARAELTSVACKFTLDDAMTFFDDVDMGRSFYQ